jgi:hypothetical protein
MMLSKCSIFIHLSSTSIFINSMIWLLELFLQEGIILHDGSTISDVAVSHAFLLNHILACLNQLDDVVALNYLEVVFLH